MTATNEIHGRFTAHNIGGATFTASDGRTIELATVTPHEDGEAGVYRAWDTAGQAYTLEDAEDGATLWAE